MAGAKKIMTASGKVGPNFPFRPQMKFKTMFLQDGPKNPPAFLGISAYCCRKVGALVSPKPTNRAMSSRDMIAETEKSIISEAQPNKTIKS